MKVDLNLKNQPIFQANISPKFESFMRKYFNNCQNRLKNHYILDKKIEEYKKFGFDEYTINLASKYKGWGTEYSLVATKEGEGLKGGILVVKKDSVIQIINSFLSLNPKEFKKYMQKGRKYKG